MNRYLGTFFILFILLLGKLQGQTHKLPAMIALNREVGFVIDSTEAKQWNIFQKFRTDDFSYLLISQIDSNNYEIISINRDGSKMISHVKSETIRNEFQKLISSTSDTTKIKDYGTVKLIFPDALYFVVMDSTFTGKTYQYANKASEKIGRLYIETGYKYVSLFDKASIHAFQLNIGCVINKFLVSGIYSIGKSFSNKVLTSLVNLGGSFEYKYREIGFTGGWIITNKDVLFAVSTGISRVKYEIIHKISNNNTLFFPTYTESIIEETVTHGIPVCLDFSFPSSSPVGLSLKAQTIFIFRGKPTYGLGIGIRVGRTSKKKY